MNTASTTQGARGPYRWSKIEGAANRMADALMDGVEAFARACDELWKSIARRVSRRHA